MKGYKGVLIKSSLPIIFVLFLFCTRANAASGFQGYAVYRDGVFYGYTWHAAMMYQPYYNDSLPVVQAPGGSQNVKRDSWNNFQGSNNFEGVYTPNSDPDSSDRDMFVAMANRLANEQISYNLYYQVNYDLNSTGYWVGPADISSMRCDGLVEYIYEWYGNRVYGSSSNWDISLNSSTNRSAHSGTSVEPDTQAGYLTLVRATLPSNYP